MKPISQQFPRAKLLLVGSGGRLDQVKQVAVEFGLGEAVQFLGEREDIHALLACADILVCPSMVEPFGMVAVEAMAAGVVVVASRVGGLREIVTSGVNGLLVTPKSPAAIAQAVERLLGEPGLRERLVQAGRQRARDFDATQAVNNLLGHFREAIGYGRLKLL